MSDAKKTVPKTLEKKNSQVSIQNNLNPDNPSGIKYLIKKIR